MLSYHQLFQELLVKLSTYYKTGLLYRLVLYVVTGKNPHYAYSTISTYKCQVKQADYLQPMY